MMGILAVVRMVERASMGLQAAVMEVARVPMTLLTTVHAGLTCLEVRNLIIGHATTLTSTMSRLTMVVVAGTVVAMVLMLLIVVLWTVAVMEGRWRDGCMSG